LLLVHGRGSLERMPTWIAIPLVALAIASRPIEVRLWRAGRLSDRAVTLLVLGRFPVLATIGAVAIGGDVGFVAMIGLISLLPMLLFYRFFLGMVREQAQSHRRP
jgi:hypothetical protein